MKTDYAGCIVVLLVVAFCLLAFLYIGGAINNALAVQPLGSMPQLQAEVASVQHLADGKAGQALQLAQANAENGKAAQSFAVATKTIEEARTISDDRNAKKIGYGGLMLQDLFGALTLGGVCIFGAGIWVAFAIAGKIYGGRK